ncbi:hypothetical protein ACQPZA_20785 [Pseudonocardia xinjiangensis]|uniref:hypothetical protein n=1 Tax=Pseudonocardia xinjiangensis TaxID=75289 RepID=UPI003D90244F
MNAESPESPESDDGAEGAPSPGEPARGRVLAPLDSEPLSFLARPPGPGFRTTVVTLESGTTRAFDEAEWSDALVVVESGEVDLECGAGGRRRFRSGAVLCLTGLGLRALHSVGAEPAVLVAVARRHPAADPGPAT